MQQTVKAETQQKQLVNVNGQKFIQRISAYGALMRDGKLLLVKTHSKNWELPGGAPEAGETLKQGLSREFQEEVGMDVRVGDAFYIRESFYAAPSGKAFHSLQLYFLVESDSLAVASEVKVFDFIPLVSITESKVNKSSYYAIKHLGEENLSYDLWDPHQES